MDYVDSSTFVWGGGLITFFVILAVWSAVWKAWALWRAARNTHLAWFIVMSIINTAGILEIIYIFAFSHYGKDKKAMPKKEAETK